MNNITTVNEQLTISDAVSILSERGSTMLQFHVFGDNEKKKPIFAAFFILGGNSEAKEAITEMDKLKRKWDKKRSIPSVLVNGALELSYVMQQKDTEGVYDVSRKCKTPSEFINAMRQYGVKNLGKHCRIVKRIEIPISISHFNKLTIRRKKVVKRTSSKRT